jgi:hypothetical protein
MGAPDLLHCKLGKSHLGWSKPSSSRQDIFREDMSRGLKYKW